MKRRPDHTSREHSARYDAGVARSALVAEDDPSLLRLVSQVLEGDGWQVVQASDSDAALAALSDRPAGLDLVVADAGIVPRGAADLLSVLDDGSRRTGLVLVSGGDLEDGLRRRLESAGGVFLRKPFGTKALRTAVGEAASSAAGARGEAQSSGVR